jgi:hypothetical protein
MEQNSHSTDALKVLNEAMCLSVFPHCIPGKKAENTIKTASALAYSQSKMQESKRK